MTYLCGFHAIEERIKSQGSSGALFVAKPGPRGRKIVELAQKNGIPLHRTGAHELDRLAPGHRGIALEVTEGLEPAFTGLEGFLEKLAREEAANGGCGALVVVLDEVSDPHNYGAILRSCDQFGVDLVLSRNRRNAKHAAVIAQTSAGASSWVPALEVANLPRAVRDLREAGFWIYGADITGEPLYEKKISGKIALVVGGEAGMSRLLKEACDTLLAIPASGKIDSLNVSVAAGIFLYEICRQRACGV